MLILWLLAAYPFAHAPQAASTDASAARRMQAAVHREFGSPDVLRLEQFDKPVPGEHQVLVRIRAASVNPLDWHYLEGTPYLARPPAFGLLRPQDGRLGADYAGTIEAVGREVTRFKPGDEVFGGARGALAEYCCVSAEGALVLKPANMSFEQVAAVPVAAITALQALRDQAQLRAGQRVLINGASGGVGTFAVQIAKSLGANVTGVCSTRNEELVRSLGADRVIDYTKQDFTRGGERWDVIIDNVGNRSILDCRRVLAPEGHYVLVGGGGVLEARWLGPLPRVLQMLALSPFVSQDMRMFMADMNKEDLAVLGEMMQAGKLTPVIDRRYALRDAAAALRYLELGHARGKVVILMGEPGEAPTTSSDAAAVPENRPGPLPIALALFGAALLVTLVPIVLALVLHRRFRRIHPGKRAYRWGFYFGLQSFVVALMLGVLFGAGIGALLALGLVYGVLGWAFARRRRWAWVALTLLSFNPVAWIVNAIYLRKRWTEDAAAMPAARARA